LDEATIRVLRDIAGAVVTGMEAVRGYVVQADHDFKFGKPGPLDIVATVCAHIRDALDEHLPEHAERQKRMLAERSAREAAEDAAERAKAAE
jgi:hypothetical protein